jgi:hypothetical protein
MSKKKEFSNSIYKDDTPDIRVNRITYVRGKKVVKTDNVLEWYDEKRDMWRSIPIIDTTKTWHPDGDGYFSGGYYY